MVLADMGADVIKLEKPNGGDDNRRMGPPFIRDWSAGFLAVNRNKRSLALDLRSETGRDVFRRLSRMQTVVENFRPGVMDRFGLGYDKLAEINPRLVYCTISGFGSTGPSRNKGGFDLVAQGVSGLMSITGHPNSPPAKVGVPVTDLSRGYSGRRGHGRIHQALIGRQGSDGGYRPPVSKTGVAYTLWESFRPIPEGERFPGSPGAPLIGLSAHRASGLPKK